MYLRFLFFGLILMACHNKTTTATEHQPKEAVVLAPLSTPATASMPAASLVAASAPTSELVNVELPTTYSTDTEFHQLEVIKNIKNKTLIFHPDPLIQNKMNDIFNETSKKYSEGCMITAATTAIFSFACGEIDYSNVTERIPLPDFLIDSFNYIFVDGELHEFGWEDVFFLKNPEFTLWRNSFNINIPIDRNTPDGFVIDIDSKSVIFYRQILGINDLESAVNDGHKIDFTNNSFLKMDNFPLSTLDKTENFLENFDEIENLQYHLNPKRLTKESLPKSIIIEGDLIDAIQWVDKIGEYIITLSFYEKTSKDGTRKTRYLYANRYAKTVFPTSSPTSITASAPASMPSPEWSKTRLVIEKEEGCAANNMADFLKDSFLLTDLDRDQIGEISFAFWLGCINKETPIPLKFSIIEGEGKYSLKGTTQTKTTGGDYKPSYTFPEAPNVFLRFAEFNWNQLNSHPELLTPAQP